VLERAPHINEELMAVFVKEGRCQHFYGMNKTGSCIIVVVVGKGLPMVHIA
jgi:hypothetical protein